MQKRYMKRSIAPPCFNKSALLSMRFRYCSYANKTCIKFGIIDSIDGGYFSVQPEYLPVITFKI